MAKYSFHSKVPAKYSFHSKCYYSEIIYQYAPVLELNFLKIKFQCKIRFVENQVIGNQTLKNKKIIIIKKIMELKFVELEFHLKFFKNPSSLLKFNF